jgi:hypothetical protein
MSEQPTPTEEKDPAPPEERFWKRYSPHHEFPLSSVGSIVLHILSIGALVVIAYIITRTRSDEQIAPPTLDVVAVPGLPKIAGGGGEPGGREDAPGGASTTGGKEIVKSDEPPQTRPGNVPQEKGETLKMVELQPLDVKVTEGGTRQIVGINEKVIGDLNTVVEQARKKIADDMARAARGKSGPGKGGGEGSGDGVGVGSKSGPGIQSGQATIRQRRQARWKMFFSTAGGADYLQQLRALGAYMGVPQVKGDNQIDYLLIKDIKRPAKLLREDVSKLNRIFWFDHEPRSVLGMAQALGLAKPPPFFVAFFPQQLEERLRQLEQQAFSGDESQIIETHFRVEPRGGGTYEVVLDRANPIVLKR